MIRFVWQLQALQRAAERGTRAALLRAGNRVEQEAKYLMRIGGGTRREGSPPGTPPYSRSNALRGSIFTAETPERTVIVGPTEKYGAIHEFGLTVRRRTGVARYPKRPFMSLALKHVLRFFPEEFRGSIHA
jgi:phage gpG-like protein